MVVFEEGDFWHLSFEVGPVFEEIAFVELVELVPDFVAAVGHEVVDLF